MTLVWNSSWDRVFDEPGVIIWQVFGSPMGHDITASQTGRIIFFFDMGQNEYEGEYLNRGVGVVRD